MKHFASLFFALFSFQVLCANPSEIEEKKEVSKPKKENKATPAFDHFTGKITKNRVRLRLQSNFEGQILREFNKNDLVLVTGENEDFYAIDPPSDFHGYIFRTYVLDNVVEGNRVNVRLKPDLDAPVVAQLETGYRVDGSIASSNPKWLEIRLPKGTHFYIAKEFIEKAGDAGFKTRTEKKKSDLFHLLETTNALSRIEIQKPFDQMKIDGLKANYEHIIHDFPDFPDASTRAKDELATLLSSYTAKKVDFLERQAQVSSVTFETNKKLTAELSAHKSMIANLENEIEKNRQFASLDNPVYPSNASQLPANMSSWLTVEENLYNEWFQKNGQSNPQEYYQLQKDGGFTITGIIDSYNRTLNNKPGDYMLLNPNSKLPIAFLYSTHINLQDYIGKPVRVLVSERNNHHFAFPAYFVLKLE
jgi:hypothetical protein